MSQGGFIFMSAIRMLGFLASQTSVDPALKRTLIRRADEMLGGIVAGRAAFERAVSVRDAVTAFVRDLVDLLPSANADAGLADRHPYLAELLIFLYAMPCDNFDASTLSNAQVRASRVASLTGQYFEMLLCHTFAVAGMFTIDGAGDARRIRLQQIVIRNNLVDAIGTNLNFRLSASSQLGDQAALTALALFSTLVVKTVVEPERLLAARFAAQEVPMKAFRRVMSFRAERLSDPELRSGAFLGLIGLFACCRADLRGPTCRLLIENGLVELLIRLTVEMLDNTEGALTAHLVI